MEQPCKQKSVDQTDKECSTVDAVLPPRDPHMPKSTEHFSISAQRDVCHKSDVATLENDELFLHNKACVSLIAKRVHGGFLSTLSTVRETRDELIKKLDQLHGVVIQQARAENELLRQLWDRMDYHHTRNLSTLDQKLARQAGDVWRKMAGTAKIDPLPNNLPDNLVKTTSTDAVVQKSLDTVASLSLGLRKLPKPRYQC